MTHFVAYVTKQGFVVHVRIDILCFVDVMSKKGKQKQNDERRETGKPSSR